MRVQLQLLVFGGRIAPLGEMAAPAFVILGDRLGLAPPLANPLASIS